MPVNRWKCVPDDEVGAILKDCGRKGTRTAGCVARELCRIYGTDNIKHRMGYGWYKLVPANMRPHEQE